MCKERKGSLIFCTESRVSRWTREDPRQESFSHTVRRRRPGDSPQLQQGRGQDQGGGSQPPATGGGRAWAWAWREDREVASPEPSGGLSQEWGKVPPSALQASMDCWCRAAPRGPGEQTGESASRTEQAEDGPGAIWRRTRTRDSI